MSVQLIKNKKIVKHDTDNPNFKPQKQPIVEVNGNVAETEQNVYGENVYQTERKQNDNVQMEELMGKLIGKLDDFGNTSQTGTKAVEVDIRRAITLDKVDKNAVKSEVIKGKVKTKTNKLRELRQGNRK